MRTSSIICIVSSAALLVNGAPLARRTQDTHLAERDQINGELDSGLVTRAEYVKRTNVPSPTRGAAGDNDDDDDDDDATDGMIAERDADDDDEVDDSEETAKVLRRAQLEARTRTKAQAKKVPQPGKKKVSFANTANTGAAKKKAPTSGDAKPKKAPKKTECKTRKRDVMEAFHTAAHREARARIAARVRFSSAGTVCEVVARTAKASDCHGRPSFAYSASKNKFTISRRNVMNKRADSDSDGKNGGKSSGSEFKPDSGGDTSSSDESGKGTEDCDHALELQVMTKTFDKVGICEAIDELITDQGLTTAERDAALKPVVNAINVPRNLFLLDSRVNGAKKTAVGGALSNGLASGTMHNPTGENQILLGKVKEYLDNTTKGVKAGAAGVARDVDTKTKTAITALAKHAQDRADCEPNATKKAKLEAAIKKLEGFANDGSVVKAWNAILAAIAANAA